VYRKCRQVSSRRLNAFGNARTERLTSGWLATCTNSQGGRKSRGTKTKQRPLLPGISVGHIEVTAGTLGCFVTRSDSSGKAMILSNNHVLANENNAKKGDLIIQPGRVDRGQQPRDAVGRLFRFVRLKKRGNAIDAAIATLEEGIGYDSTICKLGKQLLASVTTRSKPEKSCIKLVGLQVRLPAVSVLLKLITSRLELFPNKGSGRLSSKKRWREPTNGAAHQR